MATSASTSGGKSPISFIQAPKKKRRKGRTKRKWIESKQTDPLEAGEAGESPTFHQFHSPNLTL